MLKLLNHLSSLFLQAALTDPSFHISRRGRGRGRGRGSLQRSQSHGSENMFSAGRAGQVWAPSGRPLFSPQPAMPSLRHQRPRMIRTSRPTVISHMHNRQQNEFLTKTHHSGISSFVSFHRGPGLPHHGVRLPPFPTSRHDQNQNQNFVDLTKSREDEVVLEPLPLAISHLPSSISVSKTTNTLKDDSSNQSLTLR